MTEDELKKYKKQIEALKKDFHKDNLDNIESKRIPDKEIMSNKIGTVTQATNNLIKETPDKITESKNPFLDALKDTDKTLKELTTRSEQTLDLSQKETVVAAEKPIEKVVKEVVKPQPEKILEVKKEEKKVIKVENSNNDVPPIVHTEEEKESKFPFLKYLFILLLLALIGFVAYYFINKNKGKSEEKAKLEMIEKAYTDSIQAFDDKARVQEELEEKYNEDNVAIPISDTIYNLVSRNPEGYYAIIGSYSELKNASKLKTRQKTAFTSYIFEQSPIRIGLKLSEDESNVYEDLETVRKFYPEAWVLYNKN